MTYYVLNNCNQGKLSVQVITELITDGHPGLIMRSKIVLLTTALFS